MTATIRRYRDSDRAAVYEVCVETADAGRGVRGRYSTDDLVPDIVAGPYPVSYTHLTLPTNREV